MRLSVSAIAVVVVLAAVTATSGIGSAAFRARALAQQGVASNVCDPPASGDEFAQQPATDSTLADGFPSGLTLSVLADRMTESWPEQDSGLVLTVRQLSLLPDAATAPRRTQGPLLLFVEAGTVEISVNGVAEPHAEGSALLVETLQSYAFSNTSAEPATLLRLALVPPGEETKVGSGAIAVLVPPGEESDVDHGDGAAGIDGDIESVANAELMINRLLLSADIPAMSGPVHLFLACLSWSDPAFDPGAAARPGPVGLLVLQGQLLIGESGVLESGSCTVFPPEAPRHLRAGEPPPLILMFGAIPAGTPLWMLPTEDSDAASTAGPAAFACGEPAEPPAAASAAPGAAINLALL